jgi:hypothetical protein
MNKNILIAGGSGLVGQSLSKYLVDKGYNVNWLSRHVNKVRPMQGVKVFKWDTDNHFIDLKAIENVSVIVNLAGQSIVGQKWTERYKEKIVKSRINSSLTILKGLEESGREIDVFIGASAVGYYGMRIADYYFTEVDKPGNDFLADTCVKWEKSYEKFYQYSKHVSVLRLGLILSQNGGFYPQITKSFKYGFGVSLAPGKQIMPCVHVEDVVRAIYFLIQNSDKNSTYNLVSDIQPTYDELINQVASTFQKPMLPFRLPEWFLKLILGEQYKMLTTGVHVSNGKIKQVGFKFKYNNLNNAIQNLI